MNKIELLSPARDLECAISAINCGADAIYIGAPKFSARTKAGVSVRDIEKIVHYAHQYWAKVYIAFNTLLFDHEFAEALKLIKQLNNVGVDALIIQDMGLLECDLPSIPLIASTQMHNNTKEKILFLEKIGLQRVILARELSLEQIKNISKHTSIQLEFFVHGALCVSYSGQCYMSYALGGRSGNRGDCAQPCRKKYNLVDKNGNKLVNNRYLLSLKDLNHSQSLENLLDAGITSFKIEGRLKNRAYIANVVSFYRQKLDTILKKKKLAKSSSGNVKFDFIPDLNKTFNRGYTDYFLYGNFDLQGSIDTPKMTGQFVGKVQTVNNVFLTLDRDTKLSNGDGLCFFDENSVLRGTSLNKVSGRELFPQNLAGFKKGISVYRNYDHKFIGKLLKNRVERKILVRFSLSDVQEDILLTAIDEDGNNAQVVLQNKKKLAKKPKITLDIIKKQLCKTGNTIFTCTKVEINWQQTYFVSISEMNSMRRSVLEKLIQERIKNRPQKRQTLKKNKEPYPYNKLTYLANVLNQKAASFYRQHSVECIEPGAESGINMQGKRVMRTKYCVLHQLRMCKMESGKFVEPLYLINESDEKFELHFDCKNCEMYIYYGNNR